MNRNKSYDWIIIGAGIYGLYAAKQLTKKKLKVAVIEQEPAPFTRASYINQARVHLGYHYPRSLSTARKSAQYFNRFCQDFRFAINKRFIKHYAIAKHFSATNAEQFKTFCDRAGIPLTEVDKHTWFKPDSIEACFKTHEYAFDALAIRDYLINQINQTKRGEFFYGSPVTGIRLQTNRYEIKTHRRIYESENILNTTYASSNQILNRGRFKLLPLKYEICEVILCQVSQALKNTGLTVMDGPFFSLMPFGDGTNHSLTSVTFTPHRTSNSLLPKFVCQKDPKYCSPKILGNCDGCPNRPVSAWPMMAQMAHKFLQDKFEVKYLKSLFAIKPIPQTSELDDSRPTIIQTDHDHPNFTSVLSGKINTIYDLDEVL